MNNSYNKYRLRKAAYGDYLTENSSKETGDKDAEWAARIRKGLGPEYANYNDEQIKKLYGKGNIMTSFGEDSYVAPDLKEVTITSETDKERRDAYSARAAKYFREHPNDAMNDFLQTVGDYTISPIIDGVSYIANNPSETFKSTTGTLGSDLNSIRGLSRSMGSLLRGEEVSQKDKDILTSWSHRADEDKTGLASVKDIWRNEAYSNMEGINHLMNVLPAAGGVKPVSKIANKLIPKIIKNYATDISKGAVKKLKKSSTNQVLTQQERLLNEEIKKKFFRQQAELPIEEIPAKGFNLNKVPKDMHNRITPENYEEFVNKIHGSTGYQTAKKSNKLPTNVGVGSYSSPGTVFTDATVKKTGKPLSNIGKDVIAAHEKNHGMFHGTLSEKMKNALLKPFKGGAKIFEGYGAKEWADEVFARMGQMKNALGFKGNEVFTKKHLDLLRKDYTKYFIDNSMSNLFNKLTPGSKAEKEFIKNMNKYAFGAAAVATGAVSKKAYGGQISTNNNIMLKKANYGMNIPQNPGMGIGMGVGMAQGFGNSALSQAQAIWKQQQQANAAPIANNFDARSEYMADGGSIPSGFHMMPDGTMMPGNKHKYNAGGPLETGNPMMDFINNNPEEAQRLLAKQKYRESIPKGNYTVQSTYDGNLNSAGEYLDPTTRKGGKPYKTIKDYGKDIVGKFTGENTNNKTQKTDNIEGLGILEAGGIIPQAKRGMKMEDLYNNAMAYNNSGEDTYIKNLSADKNWRNRAKNINMEFGTRPQENNSPQAGDIISQSNPFVPQQSLPLLQSQFNYGGKLYGDKPLPKANLGSALAGVGDFLGSEQGGAVLGAAATLAPMIGGMFNKKPSEADSAPIPKGPMLDAYGNPMTNNPYANIPMRPQAPSYGGFTFGGMNGKQAEAMGMPNYGRQFAYGGSLPEYGFGEKLKGFGRKALDGITETVGSGMKVLDPFNIGYGTSLSRGMEI